MTFHQFQLTENDKKDPIAQKHSAHGQYEGIVEKRHTTDILFLLLIIAVWVVMSVIGYEGITNGNPWRLIRPVNDEGQVCGQSEEVIDQPNFYTVLTNGIGVCVNSCGAFNSSYTSTNTSDYYCLQAVYDNVGTGSALQTYITSACWDDGKFKVDSDCGCQLKFTTESVLRRCTFTDASIRDQFDSQRIKHAMYNFVGDILEVKGLVFGYGTGAAIILGFIWITVLRFKIFATVFTWTCISLVQASFVGMTYIAYITAEKWDDDELETHDTHEIIGMRVISGVGLALAVFWFLFICINCGNIQLAIKTLGLTAECVEQMPLIVFTPLVQIFALACFAVPWAIYVFYTASLGSLESFTYEVNGFPINYVKYTVDSDIAGRLFYLFFCYLWTAEWILAVGSIIISISVATWYFTKPDGRTIMKSSSMLCSAYATTIRYHLGTAAFGSLIVAIVEFIRYWIMYIEAKMKAYAAHPVIKYALCCLNCCLWCVEKCLRFINKMAYIQTAIHGTSFCWAAKEAFFLICRNVLRIGALHVVSGIAMIIGKVFIMGIVGTTAFYIFEYRYDGDLNGMAAPTIMTMIVAYNVACMFTEVMSTGVDCMIQCYITDEEVNGKAVYATHSMTAFIEENTMTQDEFDKNNPRPSIDSKVHETELSPVAATTGTVSPRKSEA